jgi:RHS repeat-associated protein
MTTNWQSQFSYDGKMRRRVRQEFTWQSSTWVQTNTVYYIYDGNLVIQERDVNNLPTTTYTRGKDLSGGLERAGGIGGLLARTDDLSAVAPGEGESFYHADGSGNVTMLINSSQAIVAHYLYDAFGNILSKSGLLADANSYRFSSKERDLNSGLVYYLYRYYDPNLQRWPNRDPFGELGAITLAALRSLQVPPMRVRNAAGSDNLYEFVRNDPEDNEDMLGLGLVPGAGTPKPPGGCPPGTHPGWNPNTALNDWNSLQPPGWWGIGYDGISFTPLWPIVLGWDGGTLLGSLADGFGCQPNQPPCPSSSPPSPPPHYFGK